jgi:DNA (cytosine-5)-methyltransferase 1
MKVAALFAGIAGIERGLAAGGDFEPVYFSEWWEPAQTVLRHHYPGVQLDGDIREIRRLPKADIVTGGFPCTDLSQAGRTAGIDGDQSGLVLRALDLIDGHRATWLMLENVRNMLPLHGGRAMAAITAELNRMGFRWAYRLLDARFTGVPQRRQRVILLASRTEDPRPVLFGTDKLSRDERALRDDTFGFYWTEGLRGLGWCQDGVPTLKGGSTIGIPSPPAIWRPSASSGLKIVTPGITSAERLQGFPKDWTKPAETLKRGHGLRWKLVGNAVPVGIAEWVGRNLTRPNGWNDDAMQRVDEGRPWPTAAWGDRSGAYRVDVSLWPERQRYKHLADLVGDDVSPLSLRATAGFLDRLSRGNLHVPAQFPLDLKEHVDRQS